MGVGDLFQAIMLQSLYRRPAPMGITEHRIARAKQARRHGPAHIAKPDKSDGLLCHQEISTSNPVNAG
jgi:hypothetical protein